MMVSVIYILLALLSLAASIFCFGNLLVSCAGHPPSSVVGMWIIPLSLLGGSIFLYLSIFLWKSRITGEAARSKREAILLPKRILIFLVSFIAAAVAFFLLSIVILELAIATEGKVANWIGYVLYALFTLAAVYVGALVYGKLAKSAFNK
jgi:hypothetical protein